MSAPAQVDWFAQNAPKPASTPAPQKDWFAENAPGKSATKTTALPDFAGKATSMRAAPKPLSKEWWKQQYLNAVDKGTSYLPAAGATAGGIIGGGSGAFDFGSTSIPGAIGGAGFGGMGGEALKQIIRRAVLGQGPATAGDAARDITTAGITNAAVEGVGHMFPSLSGPLESMATRQYEKALAPTTKEMKATAQDIVPGLIERGEMGSIEGLEKKAGAKAAEIRPKLNQEYQNLEQSLPKLPVRGPGGRMAKSNVGQLGGAGRQVISDLDKLKTKYFVKDAAGQMQNANPEAVQAIEKVQGIVKQYGQNISPTSLRQLKQVFDEPVAHAGGYGAADLDTHYALNAKKAAANSIRDILHQASPNLAALDKEISFWLDVQKVTSETALRRTGQAGGLMKVLSPLAYGTAVDAGLTYGGVGHGLQAGTVTVLTVLASQMMRSPLWRTSSAVFKDRVADALASGSIEQVGMLAARLGIASSRNNGQPKPADVGRDTSESNQQQK